ncbi:MAG TPA: cupin domain-containing protein [Longimicrobiaceae bacterium]|nr:cupin domain-containing protein [Longimicrobiaceae bacterium]
MHPRAEELVRRLGLQPHPEGGFYREVFRSTRRVQPYDARPPRTALTLIYFLLVDGGHSRWHRVTSDEAWSWVEGDPLELARMDAALTTFTRETLGPPAEGCEPAAVIAAGEWQAARTTGAYTLVTCAVGPGFEFADFAMLSDLPELADEVARRHPEATGWI